MPAWADRDLQILSFNNGVIPGTLHWMAGAGTRRAADTQLIDDRWHDTNGLPTRIRLLRSGGTRIAVYRYPAAAGGLQEGHVAALAPDGPKVEFVSIHGRDHGHAEAATAMLIDLLKRADVISPP
jgi:hypothetical protein